MFVTPRVVATSVTATARDQMVVMELQSIGRVASPLTDRASAPMQGFEGSPEAWIELEPEVVEGLDGIAAGQRVIVLTWLDRADRAVLRTRPRDDPDRPELGVFATRSPDRPNPIGLHLVEVVEVAGARLRVRDLEALDGTPVVDIKPQIHGVPDG
jgi:tRNA-Thr(GGU) m(6)t(6)A37 methyltransferase TsaA